MSYFLKKTNNKKGTYLQIYESYYDPTRKCGAHRSYKPLGYVHELQATGIEDPIAVFTKEVQKLNQKCKQKKQAEKEQHISDVSPEKHLGYFPLKNINDSLGCKRFIDLMQTATNFRFNIFDMMSALIMDFSLLSPLEFFVVPKNGDGRNNKPPAMRVRVDCYTKNHLSVYNRVVQAVLQKGKVIYGEERKFTCAYEMDVQISYRLHT